MKNNISFETIFKIKILIYLMNQEKSIRKIRIIRLIGTTYLYENTIQIIKFHDVSRKIKQLKNKCRKHVASCFGKWKLSVQRIRAPKKKWNVFSNNNKKINSKLKENKTS